MLQDIIIEEQNFQPYLLPNHYTFIGPVNQNLFEDFFRRANLIAPVVAFSRSIHHVLSNKDAVRAALPFLPANSPLRVYVVIPTENSDALFHSSIEDYCEKFNVNYPDSE